MIGKQIDFDCSTGKQTEKDVEIFETPERQPKKSDVDVLKDALIAKGVLTPGEIDNAK